MATTDSIHLSPTQKDQYSTSDLAESYRIFLKSREPELNFVQIPSIRKLLGNSLKGKRVIDLASGSGGSTRILADLDPDELIGVDLSPAQVELAEKLSANEPNYAKIKFLARDCAKPLDFLKEPFDCAIFGCTFY